MPIYRSALCLKDFAKKTNFISVLACSKQVTYILMMPKGRHITVLLKIQPTYNTMPSWQY